ncbi:hypothetical protein CBR_g34464 [Chara braunii]|uniref:Reverse transcriptase domain-containing protein n=1 Tax=Chara braunii TaxID=69332 RepID=A0A388LIY9_CHABU|nr:hypothetical protein CBR_g34464 [Chara braunii]|eukprot:GBG82182.1 hypothetical protein CBR_g34464 [Chara braunii]
MQRKYRLGDGLLTTADLEAMNKEDFTTIGAFVEEFKKRARKVHGISEEAQCAIFLGLLTTSEAVELTRHGGGSTKLTWATIDRGVEVGCGLSGATSGTPTKAKEKGKRCDRFWDPGGNKDCYRRIGTAGVCDRAGGAKEGSNGCPSERNGAGDRGGCLGGALGRGRVGAATPDEGPTQRPCRINEGNEGKLIIGEPDFLLPQERTLMVELIKRRHRAYAFSDEERGRLDVDKIPMIRIHTVPHEPWNMRGARYPNPDEKKKVVEYLDGKIRTHVADYSSGPYASPWFCFIKPNGTLRWVQDLQRLNAVTVRDARGLPNADALSESCAGRPIISIIDLYSGYDQFPVYPPDRPVTAMHTPRGLIHMNVAPQGWTNAVAMVQRAIIRAMQSVSPHITQPYIDDLAVKGPAVKESDEVSPRVRRFVWKHVQDLEKILSLLEEHNLTASGAKSRHYMREATILGFVCSEKGRRPDMKKTDKITEWPVPFHSITDVRSFLGTCGFWRAFVKNFAAKTEHLRKLVRQDQEWVWGEEQEEVVARMKEEFREGGLVLGAPDYDATEMRPVIVKTDAGPTALGAVLIQTDIEGKERPLRFESRTLCTTERNYSQFKRETLAVLHCLRIFRNYIFGRRFILRVDPTALAYSLRNYVSSDPTVVRWLTYIWMFNFELERIPSSKNRADGLSRINCDKQEGEAVENMPPVDGFLDQEEDVRLHINKWSPRVPSCVGYPIWQAPRNVDEMPESHDDEFEEGEIKEAFRAEEYDGIYLELGLLLSCEMRLRDASDRAQRMLQRYLVRDGHLFIRREVGNPRRVVCGRNRQIDVIAALHDGIAGGHRGVQATYAKISELYYWDGMMDIVENFCEERGGPVEEVPREEAPHEEMPHEEVPREEAPHEEMPREEVRDTQRERGLGDGGRRVGKEVIEVGEDTPPQTPAAGLRLGDAPGSTRQTGEELQRKEAPLPSSGKAPSLESRAERRRERAAVRKEALTLIDRHLAAHALEHPDLEEPAPAESRQEPRQPEEEVEAEIPKRVDLRTRERAPAGETAEEKRARRTRRIKEIW